MRLSFSIYISEIRVGVKYDGYQSHRASVSGTNLAPCSRYHLLSLPQPYPVPTAFPRKPSPLPQPARADSPEPQTSSRSPAVTASRAMAGSLPRPAGPLRLQAARPGSGVTDSHGDGPVSSAAPQPPAPQSMLTWRLGGADRGAAVTLVGRGPGRLDGGYGVEAADGLTG